MTALFYVLAGITLASALLTVISRNPINSAVFMIICFFSIAGHMLLMDAQFLAMIQILVYSGAIMILIIFTLMLLNLKKEEEPRKKLLSRIMAAISVGLVMFVSMAVLVDSNIEMQRLTANGIEFQSAKLIGEMLMTKYLYPFEFVSILLITAMVGTVLVSKKNKNIKS